MKTFISWSGDRSQILAEALRGWLPLVLHFVEPWVSGSDIEAGERWAIQVGKELEAGNFGIICVTNENMNSPWLLFEAGALSKSMIEGRVVPLLLDVDFKEITGPLTQFQAKKIEKSGILDVVESINRSCPQPAPDARLHPLFEALWPQLEQKVAEIPKTTKQHKPNRPQQEILEELVSSIRGLDSRFSGESIDDFARSRRRRLHFHPMLMEELMHALDVRKRDPIRYLLLGSMLKDDLPWLYELALDVYREARQGNSSRIKEAQNRLLSGFHVMRRGPYMEMLGGRETFMFLREIEQLLEREIAIERNMIRRRSKSISSEKPGDSDQTS